ncbi:pilus assembly protein [Microbulbifer zhoushanensis]|uniref:pilus assembly protein n=1 Tax=Microbulbifer zhoushanensis TaxID=2904254 RepID=UPI001F1EA856|nr:PilC/PilY family type IV pilus protein [Microbulbifer zhoushanensis]
MKIIAALRKQAFALVTGFLSIGVAHSAYSLELAQTPLFLSQPVRPIVMLNMSNDHQLFFKAYDDYSDITGDGIADTTYVHEHEYYGYFDSYTCYSYTGGVFTPAAKTDSKYCNAGSATGQWSGNFLNWATMTRIDTVRKILYGGTRSTDTADTTVLERAFLPHDAHSFAKHYEGSDIAELTPYAADRGSVTADRVKDGITFCNTTSGSGFSQSVNSPPLLRVAKGNYSLWASNERWQCRWGVASNGNDKNSSGINAYDSSPSDGDNGDKLGEYNVRVEVCKEGMLEDNCRSYPDGNAKPSGLLQKYGEKGEILFGLMTGSYAKNKSGGLLRKNIGDISDEVNVATDGTFESTGTGSIIDTLDALRLYGYDYGQGYYNRSTSGGDNCPYGLSSFADGRCSNWGNPQSEIYLESLRYLAGKDSTGDYNDDDSSYISGLTSPSWEDPLGSDNYCAPLNVIQFNASTSSYDGETTPANDLASIGSIDTWTNQVGVAEGIHGNEYFVGESGAADNQLCTPKTVASLSGVAGTCPDAPRLEGTYDIVGLARYARSNSIRSDLSGDQTVRTFGVALAPSVPQVRVPVPGDAGKTISILPACRNSATGGNCAIVDFKIVSQDIAGGTGKLYVNWEDSEQGGDFDQDMWGVIDYEVDTATVKVSTTVIAQSTPNPMGFGFVIGGTTQDGFHAFSGINGFEYVSSSTISSCGDDGATCSCLSSGWQGACDVSEANKRTETFSVGSSGAELLQTPLYYAAKWGGYSDDALTDAEIAAAAPESYYFAIDPAELEKNLGAALEQVASDIGSASAVATNSTRLGTDTAIYQALFNSGDWSGEIRAIKLNADGSIGDYLWRTEAADFAAPADREIFTHNGTAGTEFLWDNLTAAQQSSLGASAAEGQNALNWLRGESIPGLRERTTPLGDIVNSSPVFGSQKGFGFQRLPEELGGLAYLNYVATYKESRREVVYVGSNDGMLHAFDALTGNELFAYVPSGIYDKLKNLTLPNYGSPENPHKYSVDGPLFVGDAYINGQWRNILVGTLGAGGRGLFALDVTDPANFDESDVLFEITPAQMPELGNATGKPVIAPTGDGWKVILGNGYNSANETAELLVIDLEAPFAESQAIATDGSGSNGLAAPALKPGNDGIVDYAYAGDLLGNMWKFDLTANNNNNWDVAISQGSTDLPLFTAAYDDGSGTLIPQPITSAPTLGLNPKKENATMVYFGTGSYLADSDNSAGTVIQSVYALADQGENIPDRDSLFEKVISTQTATTREVDNDGDTSWWADSYDGWYMDLAYTDPATGSAVVTGERVISKPLLLFDRLIFPSLITSSNPCAFGGSGWRMELSGVGDRYEGHSIFGEAGTSLDYAIIGYSSVITAGEKAYLPASDIKGQPSVESGDLPAGSVGRMSWRQIR